MHWTFTDHLFYIWSYTCFSAILSNHPTFSFSHRVQKSVLYICVSFAVLHVGLSLPYLNSIYMCVYINSIYICHHILYWWQNWYWVTSSKGSFTFDVYYLFSVILFFYPMRVLPSQLKRKYFNMHTLWCSIRRLGVYWWLSNPFTQKIPSDFVNSTTVDHWIFCDPMWHF